MFLERMHRIAEPECKCECSQCGKSLDKSSVFEISFTCNTNTLIMGTVFVVCNFCYMNQFSEYKKNHEEVTNHGSESSD